MMIADSDVLIDFLRGHGPGAERVACELATGRFATTAISAFELWSGAKTPRQRAAVRFLLDALQILPVDADAASKAGEIRRDLERKGLTIGMADSLVAGTCLRHGGVLITNNQHHFERVEGLHLSGRYA